MPREDGDAHPLSPHCLLAASSWPPEAPSCPRRSLPVPVSSAERTAMRGAPTVSLPTQGWFPGPGLWPSWESSVNTHARPQGTPTSQNPRDSWARAARPARCLGAGDPNRAPPAPGGLQAQWEEGAGPARQLR